MRSSRLVALSLTMICATAAARAHELWLETRPGLPRPGAPYAVAIFVGDGIADPHPVRRDPEHILRFAALGTDGETPVLGRPGGHPAGLARAESSGNQVVVYETGATPIELAAERFERYLRTDGLDSVAALRAARGESDTPGRELFARCAKTLVQTAGSDSGAGFDRVAGLTLELVFERDPLTLGGAPLPVRLLFRGEPLANALVVARRHDDAGESTVSARTDASGRALLPLDRPDFWLVGAVHMVEAEPGARADWRSWWASYTFDSRTSPAS